MTYKISGVIERSLTFVTQVHTNYITSSLKNERNVLQNLNQRMCLFCASWRRNNSQLKYNTNPPTSWTFSTSFILWLESVSKETKVRSLRREKSIVMKRYFHWSLLLYYNNQINEQGSFHFLKKVMLTFFLSKKVFIHAIYCMYIVLYK